MTAGGAGNINLTTTAGGNVILTGTTTAAGDDVVITSAGAINGSGLVTASVIDLNAVTGIGDTTVLELAGSTITADTTNGDIDINNTLATAVTVTTLTTGTGNIVFDQSGGGEVTFTTASTTAGDISLSNAGADLTVGTSVTAGTDGNVALVTTTSGGITLNGPVDAGGSVLVTNAGLFTTMVAGDITAGAGFTQNGAGANSLAGNITSTAGGIAFATQITLTNDIILDASTGGGNITLANMVDSDSSLTPRSLLIASGAGNVDLQGNVGSLAPLASLDVSGADINLHDVTTTGLQLYTASGTIYTNSSYISDGADITFAGDTVLNNDTMVDTTNGGLASTTAGNITFEGTLDGPHALTLASSGVERFNGAVGIAAALESITTDAPGSVEFNGATIRTTGAQTYSDVAVLVSNTELEGNAITFAQTINGTAVGAQSLTINDGGQTTLSGAIGGATALNNLTVDTAESLELPATTLAGNLDLIVGNLSTAGNVTQADSVYVGGTTDIATDGTITLSNASNDFVGRVDTIGTAVTLVDSNNLYLGINEATAGAISMTAGQSIYNASIAGGTNITSTAASLLSANGGVVGTLATPVTVNLPSVTANATGQQGGVSIDLSGYVGDNTIWLTQTPPGLVILNGMIINPGQIPGVPQNAYATALAVLDQTYLTGNGSVLNTKPYSTVGTLNSALYPTDDNDKAFNYGPYIYKLPRNVKVKDGGVKLPAGVQIISMNK